MGNLSIIAHVFGISNCSKSRERGFVVVVVVVVVKIKSLTSDLKFENDKRNIFFGKHVKNIRILSCWAAS